MKEVNDLSKELLEESSNIKDLNEDSFIARKLKINDLRQSNISSLELSNLYFSIPQYLHRKMEVNEEFNQKKFNLPPISMNMVKKGMQTSLSASQRNCILGLKAFSIKRYKRLEPLPEIYTSNRSQKLSPELIDLLKERSNKLTTNQNTLTIEYYLESQRRQIKAVVNSACISFVKKENFLMISDVTKIQLPFTFLQYFCTSKRLYIPELIKEIFNYEFLERPLTDKEDLKIDPSVTIFCHSSKKYSSRDYAFDVQLLNKQFSILFEFPSISIFGYENSKSYNEKLSFEDILNIFNIGLNNKENIAKTLLTENRLKNYLNFPIMNGIKEKSFPEKYLKAFMNESHYSFYYLGERITIVLTPFKIIANKTNEENILIYRPNMKQFKNFLSLAPLENIPALALKKMLSKDKTKFLHMDVSRLEPALKHNLSTLDTLQENQDYNFENQNLIKEMTIDNDKFKVQFINPTIFILEKKEKIEFECNWKSCNAISKNNYRNYIEEILSTIKSADKKGQASKTSAISENINRNIKNLEKESSRNDEEINSENNHHRKYFFKEIFRAVSKFFRGVLKF